MITGKFNIVLGLVTMILAGITAFALGLTRDAYFENGYEQITYWRSLTRVGHTHGMPFGMINILFGSLIGRAACSSRFKRYGAVFTASALCLPLGVALRGLTEGAMWAKGLAMLGGTSLIAACVIMIIMVVVYRLACRVVSTEPSSQFRQS